MCFCFAVSVDDSCLNLMFGYVVVGYVNLVCVLPICWSSVFEFDVRFCCYCLCKVGAFFVLPLLLVINV